LYFGRYSIVIHSRPANGRLQGIFGYGQEINAETYAIAKADLLLKGEGEAADNIVGGPEYLTRNAPQRGPANYPRVVGRFVLWKSIASSALLSDQVCADDNKSEKGILKSRTFKDLLLVVGKTLARR
jgi:hypothetical protein